MTGAMAQRAYAKRKREKALLAGVCIHCLKPLAPTSKSFCEGCLGGIRKLVKAKRQARIAAGSCVDCDDPPDPGLKRCRKHLDQQAAACARSRNKRRSLQ